MIKIIAFIIMAAVVPAIVKAQEKDEVSHEYAPLQEKTINYKDWRFKSLKDGAPVDLRSLVQGKRLVMVVYFAPWCPNWRNEAPVAARLYEKYKAQGLDVIGVSEYGSIDEVKTFFGSGGAPYTIVAESESKDARDKTSHFAYRQATGDTRKWGSPWNVFLEPAKLSTTGDVLIDKAWVVNGELIEADTDKFVGERLSATAKAKSQPITPCKQ
jgi:thiol-disulfide isomerase/thioredoxin